MDNALIRFLNRPVVIQRAHPSRRMWVALWGLLSLWLLLHVANLVTTWALVGVRHPHYTSHEGDPLAAWALAHGRIGTLGVQKSAWPWGLSSRRSPWCGRRGRPSSP